MVKLYHLNLNQCNLLVFCNTSDSLGIFFLYIPPPPPPPSIYFLFTLFHISAKRIWEGEGGKPSIRFTLQVQCHAKTIRSTCLLFYILLKKRNNNRVLYN